MNTSMVLERGGTAVASVEDGAAAVINAVNSPEAGQYFNIQRVGRAHQQAYDPEARRRLRELSMRLVGLN
jgi:hypothetical protein